MGTLSLLRMFPPEKIEAGRVYLKRHEIVLAEQMFRHVDADRARLRVFLPWVDGTRSVEDEYGYVRMTRENWDDHQLFDFGIFRREDDLYLGNIGVHTISWQHRRCEIGYWISGQFEGRGFVTEAVKSLERVLFGMGFHRIEIHCSSTNLRSASVPRRCGYRLEGTQREDRIENGHYCDTHVFAKLESD